MSEGGERERERGGSWEEKMSEGNGNGLLKEEMIGFRCLVLNKTQTTSFW